MKAKAWNEFINTLHKIDKKAYDNVADYIMNLKRSDFADEYEYNKAIVDYAYATVTKYGEASAALACQMYEESAKLEGVTIPPAVPAKTATYTETAIAVNGARMQGDAVIPNTVSRLVRQAGQDTTLNNALRDGAYFAWVPNGDTCAFCIMLASNGWQRMSKKALKGGHAEHIHANCDCAYTVSFNGPGNVEGYDPEEYLQQYRNAEGSTYKEKLNSIRRTLYAKNQEHIRIQKKELYEKNRKIKYGTQKDFNTDNGIIAARRVDKYGYNNLYVDDNVILSERELKLVNKQISEAIRLTGTSIDDMPIIISDLNKTAAYNPVRNYMLISRNMTSKELIIKEQMPYVCPTDERSTAVHEFIHYKDAKEYKQKFGEIYDSSFNSEYSQYIREKSLKGLIEKGVNISDPFSIKKTLGEYAYKKALANDWEEVYTEYRTKETLK